MAAPVRPARSVLHWRPWALFALAVLGLNLVWELAQRGLYEAQPVWACVRAAGVDVAWTLMAALSAAALARRRGRRWWLLMPALLVLVAAGVETWALDAGRWAYRDGMPTVAHIGLLPLVQLAVVSMVALVLTPLRRTLRW